jgi:hypothetical protein
MNNCKLILISLLGLTLLSCGVIPIKAEIKENHFRFENFSRDDSDDVEHAYLMCFHKKPTTWFEPRQYLSGEHDLWVKVLTSRRGIEYSTRVAFVNFKVELKSDKSYMLNRKVIEDKMSLWIQEVDTGIGVSEVLIADLKRPSSADYPLNIKQCVSGTI